MNFCELSDIFKSYFLNIFLDVGGPSLFSKVHQAISLTLVVRNQSCALYGLLANCGIGYFGASDDRILRIRIFFEEIGI